MNRAPVAPIIIVLVLLAQPTLGSSVPYAPSEEDVYDAAVAATQDMGCPATAPVRTYHVTALPVPVSYNHWGDIDLNGQLFVPDDKRGPLLEDVASKLATAGLGEISTSVFAMRDALAAYDTQAALGAASALQTAVASDLAGRKTPPVDRVDVTELVEPIVLRAHVGDCVRVVVLNVLLEPVSFHVHSLITPAGAGEALGLNAPDLTHPGETRTYSMWIPPWNGMEGAHFAHSHADPRSQTRHGLFGAVVAEPLGSTWLSTVDASTPAPTGLDAIIARPDGSDFREFGLFYQDEIEIVDWRLNPLPLVSNISHEYGPGTKGVSLRTEPFYDRFLYQQGLFSQEESARDHDKSQSYSSYTYGDPATRFQRSYLGDPTKFRLVNAGPGQPHIHHLHGGGIRWRTSPIADPTQFDAGLIKTNNPAEAAASQRVDVQNINPGESYNVEPEGGSGGVQQGAGDFLYHCHIAEHYLSGMWSLWRVYNTLQADLAPLPDRNGNIVAAVPSTDLIGLSMPNGTLITDETLSWWVEPQLPAKGVPGVEDASVWNWLTTTTLQGKLYVGEPESGIAFPNWKADAPGRLAEGERPAIMFDPNTGKLAFPLLRPHFGDRPPFAPDHGPAPYLAGDATAQNPSGLCPSGAPARKYNVVAIPAVTKQNAFDVDPRAEVFVLAEDRAAMQAPNAEPTSLVLRANAGDCVDVLFTNALKETSLDDASIGVHRKTNIHIHLVQFDVQASDGVVTGFNYETTVRPLEGASRLTKAFGAPIGDPSEPTNAYVAGPLTFTSETTTIPVSVIDPFRDRTGAPKIGSLVGIGLGIPGTEQAKLESINVAAKTITVRGVLSEHAVGEILGYEFVNYRWYPDVDLGVVYFHDHVNGLDTWRHGLFASLVVEPRGSRWLDPQRTTDDGPDMATGHIADIIPPAGATPFRELVLHFADRQCVDAGDCVDLARPLMPLKKEEPAGFNLRAEPLWRRNANAPFSSTALLADGSAPQGDPGTDTLRAYVGDPVEIRYVYSGQSASRGVGTFGVTGHRFQVEENLANSRTQDAMSVAISSQHNWRLECGAGGCQRQPGDYMYLMTTPEYLERGAWGLLRVLGEEDSTLKPLPGVTIQPAAATPPPTRFYDVVAIQQDVMHNAAQYLQTTMMPRFAIASHAGYLPAVTLTGPPEPLVMRARAGETIQINLTNNMPAGRVSMHAALLSAAPSSQGITVGHGPEQSVAPGETISYVWTADRELGVIDLSSWVGPHDAERGLIGALVIEPADASWSKDTGVSSDIFLGDGRVAREHVLLFSSEDPQYESSTMPYLPDVQGRVLVNFGSEPLSKGAIVPHPLGKAALTGLSTCQTDDACGPRPIWLRNPINPFATQIAQAATPTLDAKRGEPLILRVVSTGDQQAAIHLDGHVFASDADMAHCRTNLANCRSNLIDTFTLGPREARNVWIPAAGPGGAGDYMYRNHRDAFFEAGAWGILRVN